jgi:hypothetical protein
MGRHGRALMMEVSKPPDLREEPCLPRHPCLTAAVLDKPFPLSAAVSNTPMELTDRDRESCPGSRSGRSRTT